MDLGQSLVSVLIPTFNGEKWISRCFDSILNQTHENIEIICVNDGSLDSTEDIIYAYQSKFKAKGCLLKYFYQENKGQAAAIDLALKHFTGEYITWMDDDDFWHPMFIEKMLRVLKENKDCGIATCDFYYVKESDISIPMRKVSTSYGNLNFQKKQFELAMMGLSIIKGGVQMVRTECFLKVNPKRSIVHCKEGQNLQLVLPVYYYFDRAYLDEPLHYYVERSSSHCHRERTDEEWKERYTLLTDMIRATLINAGLNESEVNKGIKKSFYWREKRRFEG